MLKPPARLKPIEIAVDASFSRSTDDTKVGQLPTGE
jgi:hypothetical protein